MEKSTQVYLKSVTEEVLSILQQADHNKRCYSLAECRYYVSNWEQERCRIFLFLVSDWVRTNNTIGNCAHYVTVYRNHMRQAVNERSGISFRYVTGGPTGIDHL